MKAKSTKVSRGRLAATIGTIVQEATPAPPDMEAIEVLESAGIVGRDGPFCIVRGASEQERLSNVIRAFGLGEPEDAPGAGVG